MKVGLASADKAEVAVVSRILRDSSDYDLAWVVGSAAEAPQRAAEDQPDILILAMSTTPALTVSAIRRVMKESPCGILILANSIDAQAGPIFEALGAGAVDVVNLTGPAGSPSADASTRLLSKLSLLRRLQTRTPAKESRTSRNGKKATRIVLLGASAGGPAAISAVLAGLPADFPAPVVIVQHIDDQFVSGMADWLAQQCDLPVKLAEEGGHAEAGVVYLAGGNAHLKFRDRHTFRYDPEPRTQTYRPAIDELFLSGAELWKADAIGVLLTGMGKDGAVGLKALRNAGAFTITQDQESSVVYGIPKAAARLNAAVKILPLTEIAAKVVAVVNLPPGRSDGV